VNRLVLYGFSIIGLAGAPGGQPGVGLVGTAHSHPRASRPGVIGFAPGEIFEYGVRLARVQIGRASLAVQGPEEVGGRSALRVSLDLELRMPFFKVRERRTSWIETAPLRSLRFERETLKGNRREVQRYLFDQESGRYRVEDLTGSGGPFVRGDGEQGTGGMPPGALDEVAALFLLRTLPLHVGQVHRLNRYFDPKQNPLTFRVLGREDVRVPAGKFRTLVIQPTIPAMGIFRPERKPRLYLTDDRRRLIIQVTASAGFGDVTVYLKRYAPGVRAPAAAAR